MALNIDLTFKRTGNLGRFEKAGKQARAKRRLGRGEFKDTTTKQVGVRRVEPVSEQMYKVLQSIWKDLREEIEYSKLWHTLK